MTRQSEFAKVAVKLSNAQTEIKWSNSKTITGGVHLNHTAGVELIGSGVQAVVEVTDVSLTGATTETSVPLKLTTTGWMMIHAGEHQNTLTSNTNATVKMIVYNTLNQF